jgi:hypothetical protein
MKMVSGAFALTLVTAGPAAAETLKAVPATLNPNKAYVLVEYRLQRNTFAAGLPGSPKWNPLRAGLILARYDPERGDVRGLGLAADRPLPARQRATEFFRNREIVKADGARLMLLELEPDTWVIQGWGGTSFSLGSYSFRLEPGTVTDLGVVTGEDDWAEGDHAQTSGQLIKSAFLGPFAKRAPIAPARVTFRPRGSGDIPLPAALAPSTVAVSFSKDARFGNHLGGLVNRIEGVNAPKP